MAMALALRQSTASLDSYVIAVFPIAFPQGLAPNTTVLHIAEFRGPGKRAQWRDDSDDHEMDMDQQTRTVGGRAERVILLGDSNEVPAESFDNELSDQQGSSQHDPKQRTTAEDFKDSNTAPGRNGLKESSTPTEELNSSQFTPDAAGGAPQKYLTNNLTSSKPPIRGSE
jgi:hypothetical protein